MMTDRNLTTGNHLEVPLKGFKVVRMNKEYECSVYDYEFYIGRRDFIFPYQPEDDKSYNPYYPYAIGRRDFIFPEYVCKESDKLSVEIYSGNSLLLDELPTPLTLPVTFYSGYSVSDLSIPTFEFDGFFSGNTIEDIRTGVLFSIDYFTGNTLSILEYYNVYSGNSVEDIKLTIPHSSNSYTGAYVHNLDLQVKGKLIGDNEFVGFGFGYDAVAKIGIGTFDLPDTGYGFGFSVDTDIKIQSKAFECYTGSSVEVLLKHTSPTVKLGEFNAYSGNWIQYHYIGQVNSGEIYPYEIAHPLLFVSVSVNGSPETFFDRIIPCCSEDSAGLFPTYNRIIGGNDHYWEMNHKINVNEEVGFNITHQLQKTELTTRSNLAVRFFYGFTIEENDIFFRVNDVHAYIGNHLTVKFKQDYTLNLCNPFTLISGDNVNIELQDVISNNCSWYSLYTGFNLSVDALKASYRFGGLFYSGNQVEITLETPRWESQLYFGFELWHDLTTTPRLESEMSWDWCCDVTLYEPTIDLWFGYDIEPITMRAEYFVEFLEEGCLSNEYIYIDNDYIRRDKFTIPEAVEFLPYLHDIKARCF